MDKKNILDSIFVINGIREEVSLRALLEGKGQSDPASVIVDECPERVYKEPSYDRQKWAQYGKKLLASGVRKHFDKPSSEYCTIKEIETALISTLFCEGDFSLDDLSLDLKWKYSTGPGANAALYYSVRAASEYLHYLGTPISNYEISESYASSFDAAISFDQGQEDGPYLLNNDIIDAEALPSCDSILVYVPFETLDLNLNATLFAQIEKVSSSKSQELPDPTYFEDAWSVTRELISDGIALSAIGVGYGGLYTALSSMCTKVGLNMSLQSFGSDDTVEILFSETPGVVLQIATEDLEYFDSQLLLEDIAYYPLGTTTDAFQGIRSSEQDILGSLISALSQNNYR